MPVVNREQERMIVEQGRAQGKSDDFIKQAVLRYRSRATGQDAEAPTPAKPIPDVQDPNKRISLIQAEKEVLKGAGKGILSTVKGTSELGEKMLDKSLQVLLPKKAEKYFGLDKEQPSNASALQTQAEQKLGYEQGTLTTPTNTGQKIGFGVEQIGEFFVPGSAGVKAGRAVELTTKAGKVTEAANLLAKSGKFSEAAKTAEGITRGQKLFSKTAKIGTTAAAEGVLGTGQSAMQSGELGKEELKTGGITTILGGVLGGGIEAAKGLRKIFKPNVLEARMAYADALNLGKAELKKFKEPGKVDKVIDLFMDEQIPIQVQDKGTKFATKGEPLLKVQEGRARVENTLQDVLAEWKDAKYIDLEKVRSTAQSQIRSTKSISADTVNKRLKFIDELIDQEVVRYGRYVDPPTGNEVKRGFWNIGYDLGAKERTAAARHIGNAIKTDIEEVTGSGVVKNLNERLGLYLQGEDLLKAMDGKAVRGGRLGGMFNRVVGAVAGGSMGPFGSLAGAEASARLAQYITDPSRITAVSLKALQKEGIVPKTVQTIEDARAYVQALRKTRSSTKLLGPGAIRMPLEKDTSGIIKNAPQPTILPYEPLPPSRQLKSGETSGAFQGETRLLRQGTQMEPQAKKIGNQPSPITKGDRDFYDAGRQEAEYKKYQMDEAKKLRQETDGSFLGQQENNYENFVGIVKNPQFLNPKAKEAIQMGDVETFKKLIGDRSRDIFGVGGGDDEVFDAFRERLLKENPNILGTQKLMPKFRLFKDGKYKTSKEEAHKLLSKMFPDDNVEFFLEGTKLDKRGNPILGQYANSLIELMEKKGKVSDRTLYHEAFHKYLDLYMPKEQKRMLLKEANKKYADVLGTDYGDGKLTSEEILSEMFAQYAAGKRTVSGRILEFFQQLVRKIQNWSGKRNQVMDVWDDILSGKAKTAVKQEASATPKFKLVPGKEDVYQGEKKLTLKTLEKLKGRSTVSKQFISDLTNQGDLKQAERDVIRQVLEGEDKVVNVKDFAKKVNAELLPLKRVSSGNDVMNGSGSRYERITLPFEERGNVMDYSENIYESPIKTSAGKTHFSGDTEKYFGHTRIEDMADKKTRRVIEVQSDLFQKGNLEKEFDQFSVLEGNESRVKVGEADMIKRLDKRQEEAKRLKQYNDPTAHFRMIREEVKKAAQDGKTKLQFPTGETAMKIEGLGQQSSWFQRNPNQSANENWLKLTPEDLSIGKKISDNNYDDWIVTGVTGEGKFKAMSSLSAENDYAIYNFVEKNKLLNEGEFLIMDALERATGRKKIELLRLMDESAEQFDISGKVDTNNPIYRFYEKDVQKYLSKFGGEKIVDDKGVAWIEVPVKKEWAKMPVEAFGLAATGFGLKFLNSKEK